MKAIFIILTFITSFGIWNSAYSQVKMGEDIDGLATYDSFGKATSLSADGKTIAIGAPEENGIGDNGGYVQVFTWDGASWIQKGSTITGLAVGDFFGTSVSISANGNIIAIGAPLNAAAGVNSGNVQVFEWDGTTWNQKGSTVYGYATFLSFGTSVSLSADGNTFAVGVPFDSFYASEAGATVVYHWSGTDWIQKGSKMYGEYEYDHFGKMVFLSANGQVIAIGAFDNDENGVNSGHVRVFEWSGTDWVQKGSDIDGEGEGDYFGQSIAMDATGNSVVVGAPFNDGSSPLSGHARVFFWSGTNWIQKGIDIDGETTVDLCGSSVAMSRGGDTIAVGSRSGGSGNRGATEVFTWNGLNWEQVGMNIIGEELFDFSGDGLALSSNGSILSVGAIQNDGTAPEAGHVRVFDMSSSVSITENNISETSFLVYPNPTQDMVFVELDRTHQRVSVELMNAMGKKMYSNVFENKSSIQFILEGTPGVYFIFIRIGETVFKEIKVIKY